MMRPSPAGRKHFEGEHEALAERIFQQKLVSRAFPGDVGTAQMIRLCLILLLTVVAASAVPQASSRDELQRLVRLPRAEFAPPLYFDRLAGFVVFPDAGAATAEGVKLLADSKLAPADAPKYLQAGRLLQAHRDFSASLRAYGRAADLYRKRVESQTENAGDLAGLAEALTAIGRGAEGVVHLERALVLAPTNQTVVAGGVRIYHQRAWQAFGGERRFFSHRPFPEMLLEASRRPPESSKIEEARLALGRAGALLERLRDETEEVLLQRGASKSTQAALGEAILQARRADWKAEDILKRLFAESALGDLYKAASLSEEPGVLAAAAFVHARAEAGNENFDRAWPFLSPATQRNVRELCARLEKMAGERTERSAAAAEFLGATQLAVLRDAEGAQRSFRAALAADPRRQRSWELLVLAAGQSRDPAGLLEACQARFDAQPTARSSVLLAKAYDGAGDQTRAELICLAALAVHPNDFLLNLTLGSVLLKRENARGFFWRIQDLIAKAEKQLAGATNPQNVLDLALNKSIYLALSDKPAEARAALSPFASSPSAPPEVREVLRVLDR